MIKPLWSCFSPVVMQSWHHRCAEMSGQRPAPAHGFFFHPWLINGATSNTSLVRTWGWVCMNKWTAISPPSHHWGNYPRPCSLQISARTCWEGGLHGRTALLLGSLTLSLMQSPNISVAFMFATAEARTVTSLSANETSENKEAENLSQDQHVVSTGAGIWIWISWDW